MKKMLLNISLFAVLMLGGCNSGIKYSLGGRVISIETEPPGASVYQLGPLSRKDIFLGTTPILDQPVSVLESAKGSTSPQGVETLMTRMGVVRVRIEKDGYKQITTNLSTSKKETVTHKITLEQDK